MIQSHNEEKEDNNSTKCFQEKPQKKNIFKQEAKKIIQISARNREAMTRGSREIFERITTYKWPDYTTKPKKTREKKLTKYFAQLAKLYASKGNWIEWHVNAFIQ